ncbi:MAG: NAD-dependent protein deacylase [Aerococcus sp.]|nr:NAD-dependent protein deacylase [Aerococcus sp.]
MKTTSEQIAQLQEIIDQSQHLVFFGGAGVSTESGIPDFRSSKGLYMQDLGYQVAAEEIISHTFYKQHPKTFFDFYFKHLVFPDAQPNPCHQYLANLESAGREVTIITQNIDGLHQKAGSQVVYELHGNVYRNYCEAAHHYYDYADLVRDEEGVPHCPEDHSIVKPDIVLYEEALDEMQLLGAIRAIQRADVMIVAGTSLSVYPAAGLIDYFHGKHLVVINRSTLNLSAKEALVFQASVGAIFSHLTLSK